MHGLRKQTTLARPAEVSGLGFWSGQEVRLEFRPAPADSGIVFVRGDLARPVRIPARIESRFESPRRTSLRAGGASVEMVEHVLAALAGLRIDNCEVWANGSELPGCDGASQTFVEALDGAGVVEQNALRTQLVVREITRLGDEEAWLEARPASDREMSVRFRIDYGRDSPIGRQTLSLRITPATFRQEIAPARTYLLQPEAEWLLSQGLCRHVSPRDVLVFNDAGPVENTLRFPDECVRHKILDLIGDLALCGCDIVGHFIAHRSGHRLNAEMARVLLAEGEKVQSFRRTA